MEEVPATLRKWFVIHFIIDMIVALPLFFIPELFLSLLGWKSVDLVMTRIVGAAFFGIGIESLLGRNAGVEAFKGMLNLKIIWSAASIIGVSWSYLDDGQGHPIVMWFTICTFLIFHINWVYWRMKLN